MVLILTLCLALSLLPIGALAADSGACGENVRWTLDDSGTLTISGTGATYDYEQVLDDAMFLRTNAPWHNSQNLIRSVVVAPGVTRIGSHLFAYLTNLEHASIAESVRELGDYVFSGSGLQSLVLPQQMERIGEGVFQMCRNLDMVTMPARLGSMGRFAFNHAEGLKSIVIPEVVTELPENMFDLDWQLTTVVLPSTLRTIGSEVFYGCSGLKDVYFCGTEAQWNAVQITPPKDPNDPLLTCLEHATIHFGNPMARFYDVPHDWSSGYITGAVARGLMNGTDAGTFEPNLPLTRAMVVTILWRICGQPMANGVAQFSDLTQDWYRTAVAWAQEQNIVNGVDVGLFAPDLPITRQDFVTILYRFFSGKGAEMQMASLNAFPDRGAVADYAQAAMQWAVGERIISGSVIDDQTLLDPVGTATRAQAAKIFLTFNALNLI